jgi:hypothetical protein
MTVQSMGGACMQSLRERRNLVASNASVVYVEDARSFRTPVKCPMHRINSKKQDKLPVSRDDVLVCERAVSADTILVSP